MQPLDDTKDAQARDPAAKVETEGPRCIRWTARDPRAALTADHAASSRGAEVRRLYLASAADRLVADVPVAEISAPAARRIRDAIATSIGVETVSVEPLWSRP